MSMRRVKFSAKSFVFRQFCFTRIVPPLPIGKRSSRSMNLEVTSVDESRVRVKSAAWSIFPLFPSAPRKCNSRWSDRHKAALNEAAEGQAVILTAAASLQFLRDVRLPSSRRARALKGRGRNVLQRSACGNFRNVGVEQRGKLLSLELAQGRCSRSKIEYSSRGYVALC